MARDLKYRLNDSTLTSNLTETLSNLLSQTNKVKAKVVVVEKTANTALSAATGPLSLEELSDVVIVAPVTGQALTYKNGTGWINSNVGGLSFTIAGQGSFLGPGIQLPIPIFDGQAGQTIVTSANEVRVTQFVLLSSYTIRKVAVDVTALVAASTCSFGIYDVSGNKLIDSTAINSASTGLKSVTLGTPVVLPAGLYYFAQSATAAGVQVPGGGTTISAAIFNTWNAGGYNAIAANVVSGGVMPATLGVLTPTTSGTFTGVALPIFMV